MTLDRESPTSGSRTVEPRAVPVKPLRAVGEAMRFLLPFGRLRTTPGRPVSANIAFWIVLLGLVIGLCWVGVFRITWRLYGEIGNTRVVPALAVVLLESLLTGPFLVLGLARTVHLLAGDRPLQPEPQGTAPLSPVGTLVLGLTVLSQWALITSIPWQFPWWPSSPDWRHHFNFMYPHPIYRPLLLAPIWGRWGILLAATIGRTSRHADAEVVALSGAMRPARLLLHALIPMTLTAIYSSREGNVFIGVVLSLIVFAVTYLVSFILARRGGGQTRQSLYAAGQIAQLAFLAVYRAFWPLIHE